MLDFQTLEIQDKKWVEPILAAEASQSAGYDFATIYLWAPMWRQKAARVGDRLILRYQENDAYFFAYPVGSGPLEPAVQAMRESAAALGLPLRMTGVTAPQREKLEQAFPGMFRYEAIPDSYDYIYEVERLATLSGKKLHGKRNHCNKFEQSFENWSFRPMTPEDAPVVLALLQQWNEKEADDPEEAGEGMSLQAEWEAICRALDGFAELEMDGGLLFCEGEPVAFTMASKSYQNTMDVHFEKAKPEIPGAYSMINREFARMLREKYSDLQYLNREEDLGIEGLRKAKQSYQPAYQVEKFLAIEEETGQ